MLEQPRRRKKNVVEGGSLGKRGEQVSGRTQEIVKRWEREPGEVKATIRNVNKPPVGNPSTKPSGKTAAGRNQSQDNSRANIVAGWNRKSGDVKTTTTARRNTIEDKPSGRRITIEDKPSAREIKMYDRAFSGTSGSARTDQTKAHEEERKRQQRQAAEAAARGRR